MILFPKLQSTIASLDFATIGHERKKNLQIIIDYIQVKIDQNQEVHLNFICTHNSRRSQFSQAWAHLAIAHFKLTKLFCYSSGAEVTACNERTISSLKRSGFQIQSNNNKNNTRYHIAFTTENDNFTLFSKLYNDAVAKEKKFAAIMTCAHADQNCPFIPTADERIALRYEDPKFFDDTEQEEEQYDLRSLQIATELHYIFSKII